MKKGFLERLRDWWKKRHPKPPNPASPVFVVEPWEQALLKTKEYQVITDDYDLQMLIQGELNKIKPNLKAQYRLLFKELYVRLGGDLANLKMIVEIVGSKWLDAKLAQTDLPGPDEIIRPQVEKLAKQFIGDAFDDFFAQGGL